MAKGCINIYKIIEDIRVFIVMIPVGSYLDDRHKRKPIRYRTFG